MGNPEIVFACGVCHRNISTVFLQPEFFNGEQTSAVVFRHPVVKCPCGQCYVYIVEGFAGIKGGFAKYGEPDIVVPQAFQ